MNIKSEVKRKSLFCRGSDKRVITKSGLRIHPQFRYEMGNFKSKFPKYTVVPGLYIPYHLYREIEKPKKYKTIYIIRDPREVVISWYHSMKYTHGLMGSVPIHRKRLKKVNKEEGVKYCINHLQWKFSFVRSWINNSNQGEILIVRFEDITENPIDEWQKIFQHCKININKNETKKILQSYTKEKMRKKDLNKRSKSKSHYRRKKEEWEDVFTPEHINTFKNVNGNIVEELGYRW